MSLFAQTKTVHPLLTIAGAVPALGGQAIRFTIPRQSRRLQKIRIGARFNVGTILGGGADFGLGLAAALNQVKLTVSDAAGSNRACIDSKGATLHCLNRKWEQSIGRYHPRAIKDSVHRCPINPGSQGANRSEDAGRGTQSAPGPGVQSGQPSVKRLDIASRPSVTLIAGRSGSGKSTFAIRYLLNADGVSCRFLFDPRGEYGQRLRLPPQRTPLELEVGIRRGWCLWGTDMFPADAAEAFLAFCDAAWCYATALTGRKIVLIDEVWEHCSPRRIPEELAALVQEGRKIGLETVFLTQRPNIPL